MNPSARSSNSSSGNPGSHHNKISPASPNQPAFSGNSRDATTSGNSGTSSGHTINSTRPIAQQQQQFDLAESSFPPLPVLDQNVPTSTAAPTNQNITNNVSKSTEGTASDVAVSLDATSNKSAAANVPSSTAAWGESRLADVVKGTAKTKSNKADKDDTRSNSASPTPTPASHQNQQQFHSVGSQKSNDFSQTVICVKTIQNLDISLAQRSGGAVGEQQTDGELNVHSTVASLPLTPPFSPEQYVAPTNNTNNKNKPPVINKCTTADKSTKTDGSLLNGLTSNASSSPSSADNASTIQNQLLNSSFENISVGGGGGGGGGGGVATTTNVATMTSMESAAHGSSSSVAKPSIGLVVSTSTMTSTSIPKAHTQQYNKANTSKQLQPHKSSTNNPSQTQVFISHPISPSPTSPGSGHSNENFASLASPPLTNNAIVDQNAASSSARLSYAQVTQHNKELLSKTADPQLVQAQQQTDKPEKYVEKDHKRKDFSPPRATSHGDVRLDRAGKT